MGKFTCKKALFIRTGANLTSPYVVLNLMQLATVLTLQLQKTVALPELSL